MDMVKTELWVVVTTARGDPEVIAKFPDDYNRYKEACDLARERKGVVVQAVMLQLADFRDDPCERKGQRKGLRLLR